ncbi:hypothetical protein PHYPSEUDO_003621 [Phytophthora pseudosyringae]|uniref:Uncharacterized protein n=1 Tax=Phytophthora pseudosyringae TaxID=221518 RepID=A0A8T1VTQ1_9STRA|nr:hypothetical protein PHYPSEUDO_003621 [Phytophthora pseudosyringae]
MVKTHSCLRKLQCTELNFSQNWFSRLVTRFSYPMAATFAIPTTNDNDRTPLNSFAVAVMFAEKGAISLRETSISGTKLWQWAIVSGVVGHVELLPDQTCGSPGVAFAFGADLPRLL